MIHVEHVIDIHEGSHTVSYYLYNFDFLCEFSVFVCIYVVTHIEQEYVCMYVCIYVLSHIWQEKDQLAKKVANPARGQLNRKNEYSPAPVRA